MRQNRWLWLLLPLTLLLLSAACTPEEVDQLLTAVPTLAAPTPSATLGPPVIIDARVRDVSTLMRIITIRPSQGFERVVVGRETTIVGLGGHPLDLAQIRPDDIITVFGPPIGDGRALLATRIAVRPARVARTSGEPPEAAEVVISRFFRKVNAGNLNEALRLISPAARAQYGQEAWEARLRTIQRIQLLSIARINQMAWTPSWQEYLVTARVTAAPDSEWDTGLNQRYVDVVRGSSGPWLILDIRKTPGLPIHMVRVEATLIRVDLQQRVLTVQPKDQSPLAVALSEQTQVVTTDGWSLGLDELKPGMQLVIEGLPIGSDNMLPDRVTVIGVPGQPTIRLEPSEGAVGQEIHIIGSNWPSEAELKIYVTVPTATFQPKPIAGGTVNADGSFDVTLTIPRRWPDGALVTEKVLNIVVTTADFRAKAKAQFHVTAGGS